MAVALRRRFKPEEKKARSGGDLKMAKTIGARAVGKVSGSKKFGQVSEYFVWLRVLNYCNGSNEWYLIDVLNKTEKKIGKNSRHISPVAWECFGRGTFMASSGSILYFVGGYSINQRIYNKFDEVFMFDKSRPEGPFKECPPMIKSRAWGEAIAVDGKLYVFGGTDPTKSDEDPWAEYYDPELGKWERLAQPPIPLRTYTDLYAFAYGKERILVGSKHDAGPIFVYKLKLDTWEVLYDRSKNLYKCCHKPILVDDTLYWLKGKLYAYDLKSEEYYSGHVKGSPELQELYGYIDQCIYNPPLIHLGSNRFCFFTMDEDDFSILHCTKFRVVKGANGNLNASVLCHDSCQSFLVGDSVCIRQAIPMEFVVAKKQSKETASGETNREFGGAKKQGKGSASGEEADGRLCRGEFGGARKQGKGNASGGGARRSHPLGGRINRTCASSSVVGKFGRLSIRDCGGPAGSKHE